MNRYNPAKAPDPEEWLELDEQERTILIETFHEESGADTPEGKESMHAIVHAVVENQIVLGTEPTPKTLAKLIRQGLKRHDAIHAIGAILAEDIFDMSKNNKSWDQKKFKRRLEKLTAKRWKKGQW